MTFRNFDEFFQAAFGQPIAPFAYQRRLAEDSECKSCLIDIPTGCGKTGAVVLAWLWNRAHKKRRDWPRRLVYCLPMRTLVEQTEKNVRGWLKNLGNLEWDGESDHTGKIGVHILMGGKEKTDWDIHPEREAILIGTQDMLLSRALNRGYGMSRYRWPMHFGLLNNDALWVLDETQLMGPGLWTSAQLDWMRQDRFPAILACVTWWMSATIAPDFLDTSDRRNGKVGPVEEITLGDEPAATKLLAAHRPCKLWKQPVAPRMQKSSSRTNAQPEDRERMFASSLAAAIVQEHAPGTLSLAVCNTVRFAQRLFECVEQLRAQAGDAILLTSRFRPADRQKNANQLIAFERARKAGATHAGLICISTQVIEAGMDISARRLWSEIAPWPSMLQRLGRLNRDGKINDEALAYFFELPAASKSRGRATQPVGPYGSADVADGKKIIARLAEISAEQPELSFRKMHEQLASESGTKSLLAKTLKPKPEPFPRAMDVHGLFTNEPDAFGGFTDISRYVRGEDKNADATVFWRNWKPDTDKLAELEGPAFSRDEGCPVAIHRLRAFLGDKGHGWIWNSKTETWEPTRAGDIVPGMLVMLPVSAGGYDSHLGWTGRKNGQAGLESAPPPGLPEEKTTDDQAIGCWVDLDTHLRDVEKAAEDVVGVFDSRSPFCSAIQSAASFHDIGKSIAQWQQALPQPTPQPEKFWAKAPFLLRIEPEPRRAPSRTAIEEILHMAAIPFRWTDAEQRNRKRDAHPSEFHYQVGRRPSVETRDALAAVAGVARVVIVPFRPGLRHEAASTLALWHQFYRDGTSNFPALTLYLIAAHHGIVRTSLSSREQAEPNVCGIPLTISQIPWNGGIALDFDCAGDGAAGDFSEDRTTFILREPGWSGLITDLLGDWEKDAPRASSGAVRDGEPCHLGPFGLAYLEALLRAADGRASASPSSFIPADGNPS